MASGNALEVIKALGDVAFWPALAAVLVAYINRRNGRKVIVTTKDRKVVHVEGLSMAELEQVLQLAENVTAIDPNPGNDEADGHPKP